MTRSKVRRLLRKTGGLNNNVRRRYSALHSSAALPVPGSQALRVFASTWCEAASSGRGWVAREAWGVNGGGGKGFAPHQLSLPPLTPSALPSTASEPLPVLFTVSPSLSPSLSHGAGCWTGSQVYIGRMIWKLCFEISITAAVLHPSGQERER